MPLSRRPDKVTVQLRSKTGDVVMTVDLIWIHFQLAMQKGEKKKKEKPEGEQQNQHKQSRIRKKKASSSLSSPRNVVNTIQLGSWTPS